MSMAAALAACVLTLACTVAAPPAPTADLIRLLSDAEARVRRRAALAVGRVGLTEGGAPLVGLLSDADAEVRQMAAFGLGLIADKAAVQPLVTALADNSPIVQGRAAEALGRIGDLTAAAPIGQLLTTLAASSALVQIAPDELGAADPALGAFQLAASALVRLKAYEPLSAALISSSGQPISHWWPVAYALQRIEDKRALGPLMQLTRSPGSYSRAFAARGLARLKDAAAVDLLLPLVDAWEREPRVAVEAVRALGQIADAK